MSEEAWIWVNGRIFPANEAVIRADDSGFTVGEGVFETLLAINGRLWMAERHHARLASGITRLGLDLPDFAECEAASIDLLQRNGLSTGRARVRWTVSAGSPGSNNTVVITAAEASPRPETVALWCVPFTRNERGALAGVKACAYAENKVALAEARRHEADEALFLNTRGDVCEGASTNVFLVSNGIVRTPALTSGCLPGVTREVVLEICAGEGIPFREEAISPADLEMADEVFVTSSVRGIVPVRTVDHRELKPVPGALTRRLDELLEATR